MAKTQLDLSDIVASPEFSQQITVLRHINGRIIKGRYTDDIKEFVALAVVSATDEKDITMIPEGDRSSESKTFHTTVKLLTARDSEGNDGNGIADIVLYNGKQWKIETTVNSGDCTSTLFTDHAPLGAYGAFFLNQAGSN